MGNKGKRASRPISALKGQSKNTRSTITPERSQTRRQISLTKEELYEEVLKFKSEIGLLREENNVLKVKLKRAEDCLCSDDRTISKLVKKVKAKNNIDIYTTSTHLLQTLKKNNKSLVKKNEEMNNELLKLKRDMRITKGREVEMQMMTYLNECVRLKKMLKKSSSRKRLWSFNTFAGTTKSEDHILDSHEKDLQMLKEKLNTITKTLDKKTKCKEEGIDDKDSTIRKLELKLEALENPNIKSTPNFKP